MYDPRSNLPGRYVPSGGFTRATHKTFTSTAYTTWNVRDGYTLGWATPQTQPYGFQSPRVRPTDNDGRPNPTAPDPRALLHVTAHPDWRP